MTTAKPVSSRTRKGLIGKTPYSSTRTKFDSGDTMSNTSTFKIVKPKNSGTRTTSRASLEQVSQQTKIRTKEGNLGIATSGKGSRNKMKKLGLRK